MCVRAHFGRCVRDTLPRLSCVPANPGHRSKMPCENCRGSTNARRVAALLLFVAATLTGGLEAGCGRTESAAATSLPARPSVSSPPDKSVDLSNEQIGALTITPVGTHLFGVETEALGSITFDEDPAIVQAEATLIGAAATFDTTRKELARVQALGRPTVLRRRNSNRRSPSPRPPPRRSRAPAMRYARSAGPTPRSTT